MNTDDRLARLERKTRIQSRCLTAMTLALAAGLCSSALAARKSPQDGVAEVLRAHRIEVLDPSGEVMVELMGEGRHDAAGVIYLYNDDEVPSGQVRIPSASLSTSGGGQLDLFGHRGDGEATISVEKNGQEGWCGRLQLSTEDSTSVFSVRGGDSGSRLMLFNPADESGVLLRSGTSMPIEVRGKTGSALLELVEPSENEGVINLYREGGMSSLRAQ